LLSDIVLFKYVPQPSRNHFVGSSTFGNTFEDKKIFGHYAFWFWGKRKPCGYRCHTDALTLPITPCSTALMAAPLSPASPVARPAPYPTMEDIMAASRAQGLRVRLRKVGPFFRVTATRGEGEDAVELGRAEGAVRPWPGGKVLHLDSMRMTRATLGVSDRPLFGLGIFLGAVAVRHGYDAGCARAELLAINDTPLYHDKVYQQNHS
jgi:hypothetical protein